MIKKAAKAKSETISLRLEPQARFALDFICRVKGQKITTAVERAIQEAAKEVRLGVDESGRSLDWVHYWDPSEGVRTLNLISEPTYPAQFADDEMRVFTSTHREFFFAGPHLNEPNRLFVDVLWPSMQDFLALWRETKSTDPWAAGRAMAERLKAANLEPPAWPRKDVT